MMNLQRRLIKLLKTTHNPSLYLIITMLVEDNRGKDIQLALQRLGSRLEVDGIVGYYTIKEILSVDEDMFSKEIMALADKHVYGSKEHVDKYDNVTPKERIMNYLARYEGTTIHWNKTESNITTPYGVYRKSFPNAAIFKYIDRLSIKYTGSVIRRRNLKQISLFNSSLVASERKVIKDMAWRFYLRNFMNPNVTKMLNGKEAMSLFSISVNGGKSRGIKSLHSAVFLPLGSRVTKKLLHKLAIVKSTGGDINDGMLDYMLSFYKYLIKKNRRKFGIYKNGWFDRIRGLR